MISDHIASAQVTASFEEWTRSVPLDDDAGQDTITDLISGTGYMIRANVT